MEKSFVFQWHITHRCNLRCSHCYQEDYSAFESRESLLRVLGQLEELKAAYGFKCHINVTGGEPLLHPDFYWLLGEAADRGFSTAVLTNGTLLDVRAAKRLKKLGVDYVQVSLDGCKRVHDKIRGKGSFRKALGGIYALKSCGIYTDVSFTAQSKNKGELKRLAGICSDLGVDKLWFDRVVIPADGDRRGLSLGAEEYRRLCKQAAALNKKGMVSCARALQFLPCADKSVYRCTAGDTLLAMLADGTVMPCRRLPVAAGNINDNSLLEIYRDSPLLKRLREPSIPEGCGGCEYSGLCHGGAKCVAYAETGSFNAKDPDCLVNN